MTRVRSLCARGLRATKLVLRDDRVPRPVRWLAALGLLPIPGPFDELVLALVAAVMFAFYRAPLRQAWKAAA